MRARPSLTSLHRSLGMRLWVGFFGTSWNDELRALIEEYRIGGVVLFRRNVEDARQLRALIESIQAHAISRLERPLFIAVDQEGGMVRRLPFLENPAPRAIAESGQTEGLEALISHTSSLTARTLSQLGITVNLAPVLDLVSDADSHFLGTRSFGDDPVAVSSFGTRWVETHRHHGVHSVAKHFPGLSSAQIDPHYERLTIAWSTPQEMHRDLQPFIAAIGVKVFGIMVSHGIYPQWDPRWPASLSTVVCREWLRTRLGFTGLILSDDLDMGAIAGTFSPREIAAQSTYAGVDCLLLCNDPAHRAQLYEALAHLAETSALFREAHLASTKRIERYVSSLRSQ